MSTKNLALSILALFLSVTAFSQNYGMEPEKCKAKLTSLRAFHKQKDYKGAVDVWRWVYYNCPESSKNVYIIGEDVMEYLIEENKDNETLREAYIDTLILLYDQRIKLFPGKDVNKLIGKRGKARTKYRYKTEYKEAFADLKTCVDAREGESSLSVLQYYLKMAKYNKTKGELNCLDMVNIYLQVNRLINEAITADPSDESKYASIKELALSVSDECLDCSLLDSIYTANFGVKSADTTWLDDGIDLLTDKKCTSSDVLVKMMEKRYETSKTAKTATVLAKYYLATQNYGKAKGFLDEAVSLETDTTKLVKLYIVYGKYGIASSQYSLARTYANKALNLSAHNAEAYLIIGDAIAYGSSSCNDLTFGGKEAYWVAVDYYNMAAAHADSEELKAKASERASKSSAYFPTKSEVFLKSLNAGDTYQVGCWIGATTKVRFQ